MPWERQILSAFHENDVGVVAYLPDGALAGLIDRVEADDGIETVRVAREEEGVGVVSGAWLGHQRAAMLCQTSGLATTINALASLSKPARIPFIAVVSRRGDLGEFNLAQVPFGYNIGAVLDAIGIRHTHLDDHHDIARRIDMATKTAFSTEEPYIVVLESTLTGAKDEF